MYAQEHIERISEIADTMVLLNKADIDIINTAFNRLEYSDSLNIINEGIIENLTSENKKLENIVSEQSIILINKDTQIENAKKRNQEAISNLERQIKIANRKKTFWICTTGAGIAATIFLAIFKK